MAYYMVIVKAPAKRRRRKMAIEADTAELAMTTLLQKLNNTPFQVLQGSMREINKTDYDRQMAVLLGRK